MVDEEPIDRAAGAGLDAAGADRSAGGVDREAAAAPRPDAAAEADDADPLQELDGKLVIALERAGHALRTELRRRAQEAGLTLTQAEILLRLASGRLSQRRVGAIADEFDVRQPTISDAVAALERKGMIERSPSPGDARSSELLVTEPGSQVAVELASGERTARAILVTRTEGEKEVALGLLIELIAGLNRVGTIQVARTCPTCRFFRPRVGEAPRCALLDMTLGPADLRVDCPEHEPVSSV